MNSLVVLPQSLSGNLVYTSYNVSIQNSLFSNFSSCGSILSNQFGYLSGASAGIVSQHTQSEFQDPSYIQYHVLYEAAKINAITKDNLQQFFTSSNQIQNIVTLQSNTFSGFNLLKNTSDTYLDLLTRSEIYMPTVYNSVLRDRGLIIEIDGNFTFGSLNFLGNTISNIIFHLRNVSNHCDYLLQPHTLPAQATIVGSDFKYQMAHLISLKSIPSYTFLGIAGNTVSRTSIPGPLIFIQGASNQAGQAIIIANNSFTYIHGYAATAVLQINRYYLGGQYMPGVELASLVNLTDPNFWNSYILFSGNILIENNNFAEIASCPSVDSGLLAISVATVSTEPNLQNELLNVISPGNQYIQGQSTNLTVTGVVSKLIPEYQQYLDSSNKLFTLNGTQISMNPFITKLSSNQYTNLSMGVNNANQSLHGSLIKFVNTAFVDLNKDVFTNIGAYTVEHLKSVIQNARGEYTQTKTKIEFDVTQIDPDGSLLLVRSTSGINNFYFDQLSCCLLNGFGIMAFRLLEGTTFNNVWLIDSLNPILVYPASDFGIIHLRSHFGFFFVGGTYLPTDTPQSYCLFNNLVGYINDYTISAFPKWDPRNLNNSANYFQNLQYGSATPIFNIDDGNNFFAEIAFQNVIMNRLYTRQIAQYQGVTSYPQILNTDFGTVNPFYNMGVLYLSNFTFSNSTYEQGQGAFLALTSDTILLNCYIFNIGFPMSPLLTFDLTQLSGYSFSPQQQALFVVPLATELISSSIAFTNLFLVFNSVFQYIQAVNTPIFSFIVVKDPSNPASIVQVSMSGCLFQNIVSLVYGQSYLFVDTSRFNVAYQYAITDCLFNYNIATGKPNNTYILQREHSQSIQLWARYLYELHLPWQQWKVCKSCICLQHYHKGLLKLHKLHILGIICESGDNQI